jgi:hypothetical protein
VLEIFRTHQFKSLKLCEVWNFDGGPQDPINITSIQGKRKPPMAMPCKWKEEWTKQKKLRMKHKKPKKGEAFIGPPPSLKARSKKY